MTKENLKKLKEHFEKLKAGEVSTGNITRDALIKSDAEKALEDLKEKQPDLFKSNSKKTKTSEAE